MRSILIPITAVLVSAFLTQSCIAQPQAAKASWLDEARPQSWNEPGQQIPAAPRIETAPDPRCRRSARAPQLDEDRQIRDRGWDLVGPFQGGWAPRATTACADRFSIKASCSFAARSRARSRRSR